MLPKPPLQSVTTLNYIDSAGSEQTWNSSNYTVRTKSEPGEVFPAFSVSWPEIRNEPEAVRIVYAAGYGATNASVPLAMRVAMLMLIQHWYENRSAVEVGTVANEVPLALETLVSHSGYGQDFLDFDAGS
jgi:uncharacterized phiE125 gp8 family phage protein